MIYTRTIRNKQEQRPSVSVITISKFQGKVGLISSNSASVFSVTYRNWKMFSGLGPVGSNRKNVLDHLFFSKESYGGEALFVLDVDYFGDPYRIRSNSKKREEEPIGSFCQAT